MGMVYAYKTGKLKLDDLNKLLADKIKNIADGQKKKTGDKREKTKGMSLDDIKDFAETKHKGLPEKVEEQTIVKFSKFKLEESKESDIKSRNPALWHQIRIAKQTLKYTDNGAKLMGGMTKDEARALLKKHDIKINESDIIINESNDMIKTYKIKNSNILDLKSIILQDIDEELIPVSFEEYHSDNFQKKIGGKEYMNYTSGINPSRIIKSGEWMNIANIKGDFDGFYSLYKKNNVYIILDGRGLESSIYIDNKYVFLIKENPINKHIIKDEKEKQIRNYNNKTIDSGYGFYMKDTKKNWNLVDKFGYDAIEMID
jgi:hypothetical protein